MRIFQSRNNDLVEIGEERSNGKYFELEKIIQNLVEKNLSVIFSGLEFIATEFQIGDLRPDTIAFDTEKKSFVIIEYKNVENRSLVDQGVAYYNLLQNHQANFVLLYNGKKKQTFDVPNINWDETRVIFISPQYTKYQKSASGFQGLPIELYEIRKYHDDIITLNRIGDSTVKSKDTEKTRTIIRLSEYVEEDYLDGKYHNQHPTEDTKKLWNQLKETIEDTFEDVEFRQKKIYGGYYLRDGGSAVCTLEARKNDILLSYSTSDMSLLEPTEFVRDVSSVGTHGLGNFQSSIKSPEDVSKAVPIITKIYQSKKRK